MATRVVEGKKPYTGGEAIDIDQNKVISLKLRDENNLIIYDNGDDEIYVDLQLPDGITPTDAFPVGVTTGRAVVADGWDLAGTIICAKTTSGDNIKLLYADDGTLWIDNGTGTFKQIPLGGSGGGADIEYVTQVEYDALPSSKLTDGKHYVIYTADSPTPPSPGWQPGVDTLVYLPLNGDALDQSGNGRDGALPSSSYEWGYIDGVSGDMCYVAYGTGGTSNLISGTYANTQLGNADRTVSVRMKFIDMGTDTSQVTVHRLGTAAGGTIGGWFGIYCMDGYGQLGIIRYYDDPYTTSFSYDNDWHNFVITYNDTNKAKMYVDGQEILLPNYTSSSFDTAGTSYFIGAGRSSDSSKRVGFSNYIIEDKARTAQEVADYYDQTKGDYGIS